MSARVPVAVVGASRRPWLIHARSMCGEGGLCCRALCLSMWIEAHRSYIEAWELCGLALTAPPPARGLPGSKRESCAALPSLRLAPRDSQPSSCADAEGSIVEIDYYHAGPLLPLGNHEVSAARAIAQRRKVTAKSSGQEYNRQG